MFVRVVTLFGAYRVARGHDGRDRGDPYNGGRGGDSYHDFVARIGYYRGGHVGDDRYWCGVL